MQGVYYYFLVAAEINVFVFVVLALGPGFRPIFIFIHSFIYGIYVPVCYYINLPLLCVCGGVHL